jgi:hypothetical protein
LIWVAQRFSAAVRGLFSLAALAAEIVILIFPQPLQQCRNFMAQWPL